MAEEHEEIALPLEWYVPEDITSRYANNFVIQHTQHEFVISFFETIPPLLLGSPEQIQATLEVMDSVRTRCVGRIILSPDRMEAFISAMQANLLKHQAKLGDTADECIDSKS